MPRGSAPSFRLPVTARPGAVRRAVRGLGLVLRGERPGSFFDIRNLSLVNRQLATAEAPPLVPDPRQAESDPMGAARFVLALLASSSRLRAEFPRHSTMDQMVRSPGGWIVADGKPDCRIRVWSISVQRLHSGAAAGVSVCTKFGRMFARCFHWGSRLPAGLPGVVHHVGRREDVDIDPVSIVFGRSPNSTRPRIAGYSRHSSPNLTGKSDSRMGRPGSGGPN